MRPDKKKTRHHDSVKCENKAKAKAAEKAKKDGATSSKGGKKAEKTDEQPSTSSASENVSEYKPRQVTSNWTKYEIPSSDDEDSVAATGPDFQFVLENASKASDHLQLKAEKDWNTKHQEFNNDFFALNLNDLQEKLDCVPWQQVLKVDNLDETTSEAFTNYAEKSKESLKAKQGANYQSVDEINRKIVESLKVKDAVPESLESPVKSQNKEASEGKSDDNLEDWLNDYLS